MTGLNHNERSVYEFIIDRLKKEGFSPTIRDIRVALNIKSTSTVHSYLEKLEKKGYIQREAGKSRTIRVDNVDLTGRRTTMRIPILKKITTGIPILAVENHDGYLDFPIYNESYSESRLFALRMRGESMIEVGIMDNDYVIVEKRIYAENGEIILALVDSGAVVRKYYAESDYINLQPCNPIFRPIIVQDAAILGKVISTLRFY